MSAVGSQPVAAGVELVAEIDAHEGPVYVADEDALYFTSVPRPEVDIKRLSLRSGEVSVLRADANKANGMTLARDGRLLVCEQGTRSAPARISLVDRATGATETLVDAVRGAPLNSPNDIVVKRDATVWFTDPSYGFLQGFRPEPQLGDVVYRHNPSTGDTALVADGFDKPNGLAFSPDERVLYVGDSGESAHHIQALDGLDGRHLFAVIDPGYPDGIKVDAAGLVYSAGPAGVEVFDTNGQLVHEIPVPGAVNLALDGSGRIFITADTAVWAARTPNPVKEA
jgi:gluconolactonase